MGSLEEVLTENEQNKVKEIYSFWGRFPSLYCASDLITFMGRAGAIRKEAVDKLGLKQGDCALEIACGTGRNLPYLRKVVGETGLVVGVDYSPEMLKAAEKLWCKEKYSNFVLLQRDAADLKFNIQFDGILSVLGLSAIPRWAEAIEGSYKLLKPGGRLVVCDAQAFPDTFSFLNPLVKTVYSRWAAWDYSKDIPKKIEEVYGRVRITHFNFGTIYIASAVK